MIRVAIIDDHPVVADGLAATLGRAPGIEVVWTVGSVADARKALGGSSGVDVVLLDVRLPDGSGLELLPGERTSRPAFLVLSSFDRPQYAAAAFKRGASGFMLKLAPTADIIAAVHMAAEGRLAFEARYVDAARQAPALTAREVEVVRLVATGRSNEEIAVELGLARKTIEAHLRHIFERGHFNSRTELAVWAEREGWLDEALADGDRSGS